MLTVTLNTWIISDTHFGHDNIIKYCDRPFNHDALIENSWRSMVKYDDDVLHLGDVAIWYTAKHLEWLKLVKNLPGQKYLLRGNHDRLSKTQWEKFGMTVISEFVHDFKGLKVLFSHYADDLGTSGPWDLNIHGHHHNHRPHRYNYNGRSFINVSIEQMDYKPIRLKNILFS